MEWVNPSRLRSNGRVTGRRAACALLASAAAVTVSAPASAQATATAESRAVIVRPLSFFRVQDLRFGAIVPGATAGTVTIVPDGTRTSTGGVTPVSTGYQPARFAGDGDPNQTVRIRMQPSSITITGPGAPMTVDQFTIGSTPPTVLTTGWQNFTLTGVSGIFNFPVGARLQVNANQAAGTYSGTFTITLEYM
jgi:spore coat protein U-like protein